MKNRFRGLSESRKLEMLRMTVEEIYDAAYEVGYTNGHETGYEVGAHNERTGACEDPAPKTPNQRRAELIQRAREFVEEQMFTRNPYVGKVVEGKAGHYKVDFVVNAEKRTVVALLFFAYVSGSKVREKAKAKCAPGEVFNADIGKAIALARELDIEVPAEFLDAVQPDEIAEGVKYSLGHPRTYYTGKKDTHRFGFAKEAVILDDTNAQYEDKP